MKEKHMCPICGGSCSRNTTESAKDFWNPMTIFRKFLHCEVSDGKMMVKTWIERDA